MDTIFQPKNKYKLIRIGSLNDGGYLIEEGSYINSKYLLGLGIHDDWSFELDFRKPFTGVDNVIGLKFLIKKLILSIFGVFLHPLSLNNYKYLIFSPYRIFSYFLNKNNFIKKMVSDCDRINTVTLDTLIKNIKTNNLFLKVDIEGSEYRILDDILKNIDVIEGLIIEFHDFDLHHKSIKSFIKKIDLELVHIHANNNGAIDKNGNPIVVEITFAKNPKIIKKGAPTLPREFDRPNNPKIEDINLKFE